MDPLEEICEELQFNPPDKEKLKKFFDVVIKEEGFMCKGSNRKIYLSAERSPKSITYIFPEGISPELRGTYVFNIPNQEWAKFDRLSYTASRSGNERDILIDSVNEFGIGGVAVTAASFLMQAIGLAFSTKTFVSLILSVLGFEAYNTFKKLKSSWADISYDTDRIRKDFLNSSAHNNPNELFFVPSDYTRINQPYDFKIVQLALNDDLFREAQVKAANGFYVRR